MHRQALVRSLGLLSMLIVGCSSSSNSASASSGGSKGDAGDSGGGTKTTGGSDGGRTTTADGGKTTGAPGTDGSVTSPEEAGDSFIPIRIACGQTSPVTDAQGNVWAADEDFSGGSAMVQTGQAVSGTDTPALYDGQRYGDTDASFKYTLTAPAGTYSVVLRFTENFATAAGQRIFDVSINGQKVLDDFDIYAAAGGQWIAIDKTFSVTVGSSGSITVELDPGSVNNPKIDALEITASGGHGGGTADAGKGPTDAHAPTPDAKSAPDTGGGSTTTALHTVKGTGGAPGHIYDGSNDVVRLHGVDRSGTEDVCTYQAGGSASDGYPGFFDGPNDQTGVTALASWHANAVRVPLNEDCWLGINGLPYQDTSAHYQAAIVQWVKLLNANGMIAIVDLHWAAPGTETTNGTIGQLPMADANHAPAFWTSVATTFKGYDSVMFDLFNEPYITDWTCWVQGDAASGSCAKDKSGNSYAVAGMATLLQAVRNAGANNVVILGGLSYSSDFSQWVSSVASIPSLAAPLNGISIDNVAASWHAYDFGSEQTGCPSQYNGYSGSCYSAATTAMNTNAAGVLSAGYPLVIGEMGISAYSASTASSFSSAGITSIEGWLENMMTWMESQGQGYVGWTWNINAPPNLVSDWTGTPTTDFGVTYKAHLQSL